MSSESDRRLSVLVVDDGVHIQCDAPGERAVSAPVVDVLGFLTEVGRKAGCLVDDSVPGELYVSWPASE